MLLARDPFFGHAYWELGSDRVHRAVTELGGRARGILRLVDIEHGDVIATSEVYAEGGRFVVRFPAADRRYAVELGLEAPSGRAIILLHSNVVSVPPCLPREKGDVVFVELEAQPGVLARATDVNNPPRLVVDYPDPAKPRRPPPISSVEYAEVAAAQTVAERGAEEAIGGGGSESRLEKRA